MIHHRSRAALLAFALLLAACQQADDAESVAEEETVTEEAQEEEDETPPVPVETSLPERGDIYAVYAGTAPIELHWLDLEECVQGALDALSVRVEETGAEVAVDPLPGVEGDRTLMTQLFQNLIGNALKFVRGKTPQIRITCVEEDGETVVGVRDNGIGIEPDAATAIFAAFKRLHSRQEVEGTGIGLSIARKAVELMEETMATDQPFFMALGFRRPHTPYIAPEPYFAPYPEDTMPRRQGPADHLSSIPRPALTYNEPDMNRPAADQIQAIAQRLDPIERLPVRVAARVPESFGQGEADLGADFPLRRIEVRPRADVVHHGFGRAVVVGTAQMRDGGLAATSS